MKNWKELTKTRKNIVLILLVIIFLSLVFYIRDINNSDNYKTIIQCGEKIITLNGTGYNLEDYCPEMFIERPKFRANTDWLNIK